MMEPIRALLGAALPLAAAWSLGSVFTHHLTLPRPVRFAIGAALLHLVLFCLTAGNLAVPPVAIGICAASITAGLLIRRHNLTFSLPGPPQLVSLILAFYAAFYGVNALAPELEMDANNYHLQPAVEAQRTGGFGSQIHFFERLPHATELLYIPAYAVGGSRAARLVHFMFLLTTVLVIVKLATALGLPDAVGWIAAALYFCAPIVGVTGTSSLNDAALAFFCLTVAWTLVEYWRAPSLSLAGIAGLLAGMCYAIKMTGGIAVPLAAAVLLARHRNLANAACFGGGVLLTAGPWILRNWIQTGNPAAPFSNEWFPNPFFYLAVEQELTQNLRTYGVPPGRRFIELALGWRLQGVTGPVFLLAPLALIAVARQPVRILLGFAVAFSVPSWFNAGTRFFMPVLPFLALLLAALLPRPASLALLVVHAVLSSPWGVEAISPGAWHLKAFPWKAALGFEPGEQYQSRLSQEYRIAKMVEQNTAPADRILDLGTLGLASINRQVLGYWQSAEGYRARKALELVRDPSLSEARAVFPEQELRSITIRQTRSPNSPWSIVAVRLSRGENVIAVAPGWRADASINKWDTPLMFDLNLVSRWGTWRATKPDDFVRIQFDTPQRLTSIAMLGPSGESATDLTIDLEAPNASVSSVSAGRGPAPSMLLRLHMVDYLKQMGITHIVSPTSGGGMGEIGAEMLENPAAWGLVELSAYEDRIHLFRIR